MNQKIYEKNEVLLSGRKEARRTFKLVGFIKKFKLIKIIFLSV